MDASRTSFLTITYIERVSGLPSAAIVSVCLLSTLLWLSPALRTAAYLCLFSPSAKMSCRSRVVDERPQNDLAARTEHPLVAPVRTSGVRGPDHTLPAGQSVSLRVSIFSCHGAPGLHLEAHPAVKSTDADWKVRHKQYGKILEDVYTVVCDAERNAFPDNR